MAAATIEELIALNQEIAALVRAGLPLERSLSGAGGDLPGRLRSISQSIARSMEEGRSITEALTSESTSLPRVYRAVVEAGVRSGRLPNALERLTEFAGDYLELRRSIGEALWYPVVVLLVAYALFLGLLLEILPRLRAILADMRISAHIPLGWAERIGDSVLYWGAIPPAIIGFLCFLWWWAGRARALDPGHLGGLFGWIPGIRQVVKHARMGYFADWVALLVDHGEPLPSALRLSASATGGGELTRLADEMAGSIEKGESPNAVLASPRAKQAPFVCWLLRSGLERGELALALRHAARVERERASRWAARLRHQLPVVCLVGIGGAAVLIYCLILFVPWSLVLRGAGSLD